MSFIGNSSSSVVSEGEKEGVLESKASIVDTESECHVTDGGTVCHHDVTIDIHWIILNVLNIVDVVSDLNQETETVMKKTLSSLSKMIKNKRTNSIVVNHTLRRKRSITSSIVIVVVI